MNRSMHKTKIKNIGKDCCPFQQHNADDAISQVFLYTGILMTCPKQFALQPKYKTLRYCDVEVHLKDLFTKFAMVLSYL